MLYKKLVDGEKPQEDWREHGLHCFEFIREELMCTANDAIFSVKQSETDEYGVRRLGAGQVRQCSDWEYLRDWAVSVA